MRAARRVRKGACGKRPVATPLPRPQAYLTRTPCASCRPWCPAGRAPDRPRGHRGDDRRGARPAGPRRPGPGQDENDKLPALAEALSGMRFGPQHAHAAASCCGPSTSWTPSSGTCKSGSPRTWPRSPRPGAWTRTALPGRRPGGPGRRRAARPRPGWMRSPAWAGRPPRADRRDRPGHEPFPDPAAPGVLGRAHPRRAAVRAPQGPGKKGHGNTYAKRIAVLAAYAAANTDTFLGERFRRLARRRGGRQRPRSPWAAPS